MSSIDFIQASLKTFRHFFKQMAPLFWGVSIMPYYIGWSLASHKIYPTYFARVLLLPDTIPSPYMYRELYVFFIGLLAIGPLLGGATLLYNDYWDRFTDKYSRRKKKLPLTKGIIHPKSVYRIAIVLFACSILLGLTISLEFTALIVACIILSYFYSAPPIRLKEKPGLDLIVNISGAGIICTIAGWITAQPITQLPVLFLLVPVFGVAAIYMPTTIIDYEPDILEGLKTITTQIGKKNSFFLGMASVILANITIITMGLLNYIISPKFLLYTWPLMLIEIFTYWYLLRKLDFAGGYFAILTFSIYAAIGNGLILFYNAGILSFT